MANKQYEHLDSAESIFFDRELETIRSQTYDIKYENLEALTHVPLDTSVDPTSDIVTYRTFDQVGTAKWIDSYAADFNRVDVFGTEQSSKVKPFGVAYGYNIDEIRRAQKVGRPLDQMRSNAARRAIEQFHDQVCRLGSTETGLLGFFNIPSALSYTVPSDGTGATKTFSTKTPDQVVRDLHGMANFMPESTKNIEKPDTMLMPLTTFNYVSTTRMSAGDGSLSILKTFLANTPYIKTVLPWTQLEAAGAGPSKRIITYRKSPEVLQYVAPILIESFSAQQKMLDFEIPVRANSGGVVCYYPLAVEYADGI